MAIDSENKSAADNPQKLKDKKPNSDLKEKKKKDEKAVDDLVSFLL